MTEGNEFRPPKIYAIWVDARPESPMAGLSGFLSENSRRLFFTERGDAELKIRDMEALRLNRHPAAEYRCVEYPGGYDAERSIQAELLKTISLSSSWGPLLIRRLTPLECERLQGFPDGWADLPGASDSARYRALGNSVAIPCVEFIMQGICVAVLYECFG